MIHFVFRSTLIQKNDLLMICFCSLYVYPCLEVSTMKLSDEFNLPIDESPYFSGLFFFEII